MTSSPKPTHPGLRGRRRKVISDADKPLVSSTLLASGDSLPVVREPTVDGLDPISWAASHRAEIEEQLVDHGAVLFRNFDVRSPERFHRFVEAVSGEPLSYMERSSPRHQISRNIYTSTDHPADQSIFPHNEHSYKFAFPLHICFYCHRPAQRGGATPLADCRRIYERLKPAHRRRFEERGYLYVRNYSEQCGLPWQTVFQTEDRAEVEAYCRQADIEWEWLDGDHLRTRQRRRVSGRHPQSGAHTWFNHMTFFHVTTLEPVLRDTLLNEYGEEGLPHHTLYGDGSPIETEVMEDLRQLYREAMVSFPWQRGDVLLIDNMLTAHGRDPYAGPRKVCVAMSRPVSWCDVPH
ncbi:MAG: TauD/TfdA family dioxygenase [Thermoanaerobaculia bacterium]